jgi:phage gpG-like protein
MASGLTTTLTITGDRDLFERVSKAARSPRELMLNVAVLGMSSGVSRLTKILAEKPGEDAVRTGRLLSSIQAGADGKPGEDTIFEISDYQAVVGTNLPYAAQRQYGGPIFPKDGHKALAIPLPVALKRARLSPSDLDPNRELLSFIPIRSGKPNVIGLLVDRGGEVEIRNKRGKLKKKTMGHTAYGPGALFVLVSSVDQEGTPFLYWGPEDLKVIEDELIPQWLRLK